MIGYNAASAANSSGFSYNVGVGNYVFDGFGSTVDAAYNTAVGHLAMSGVLTSDADYNTAIGYSTLNGLTSGDNNVAIGSGAGGTLSTGHRNILIGKQAGDAITTEDDCVLIGYNAGIALTHTDSNETVAIGSDALKSLTSGEQNTAIGHKSQEDNVTGNYNTTLGHEAGANLIGDSNVAIGRHALKLLEHADGGYNVAIGALSMQSTQNVGAFANVCVGYSTGSNLGEAADGSVLIGHAAGSLITSGAGNVAVGYQALNVNATGEGNTAVGYQALVSCINGDTEGYNTAIGGLALNSLTTGDGNTALGHNAGDIITTGQYNILIGRATGTSAVDSSWQYTIGYNIVCTEDSQITIGRGSNLIQNEFDTDNAWSRSSDVRKKRNIKDVNLGLDFINDLRTVKFQWKPADEHPEEWEAWSIDEDGNKVYDEMNTEAVMHGLVAQEVKSALDKAGVNGEDFGGWKEDSSTGEQRISQDMFVYPLIKAVQELSAKVEELEAKLK